MTAKTVMVQGTGSSVGKSLLATALCRILVQDGYTVAPFKAQNMSLNSGVTPDGSEIGRAQVVQAEAAGVLPNAYMNPILLKPEVDYRSQLVVLGRPEGVLESRDFNRRKERLWDVVAESLDKLRSEFDVVVIEGAGSPAEINLREGDIVNMEVALYANSPVLLVADIDKGGVFASVYGTIALLAERERKLVKGVIINKFRGDVSILEPGLRQLEELTNVPVIGVVPYFKDIYIPEEDSPAERNRAGKPDADAAIDVAVIALPHIANFDDFDPFQQEQGVGLRYIRNANEFGSPDLVIIPGTKTAAADLEFLRNSGIAGKVTSAAIRGIAVIGICGGYQMLGERILDPHHVESDRMEVQGLGLLPVETRFSPHKETHQVEANVAVNHGLLKGSRGLTVKGYEIHMGTTSPSGDGLNAELEPPLRTIGRSGREVNTHDGSISGDGLVLGTYLHGLFHNSELRHNILRQLADRKGVELSFGADDFSQSREFDKLATLVRNCLDIQALYCAMGLSSA